MIQLSQYDCLLNVKDAKKTFKIKKFLKGNTEFIAVNNVTFSINKGETVALVGESGSGKSTLARSILGLETLNGGEILFKGKNLSVMNAKQEKEIRKNMQIVFQDPLGSVNPRKTIENIISEPLISYRYPKNEIKNRVIELLDIVGLDNNSLYKYPHQFSGGQLQRIGIARSIALNPEFLILDEPTSALDVSVQARILKLLKELQDRLGLTYLFITHDLNVVEAFAERVLVMRKGEIVEAGDLEQIFKSPKHEYTKRLLNSNLLFAQE